LRIAFWDENFKKWFGNKVEKPVVTSELVVHKLTTEARNTEIVSELGGEAKAEISFSEFHALLSKQGDGQKGVLITNDWANVAYIRDEHGILCVVKANWNDSGWFLYAFPIDDSRKWGAGAPVVSRK
jgi:hypothetical protein